VNALAHVASFIAGTRGDAIPAEARGLATLALVDLIGCTVAGAADPVARLVARQCPSDGTADSATLVGPGRRARPVDAALANGVAGHVLDFDDSNMVLGGHPSVTLFPALLALAQARCCSGRAVLDAYVVGFEVTLAFARALNFEHYEHGWHPTATLGIFGATAATAWLLGLPAPQCAAAIGLAASMASGIKANFGTAAKALQVGEANRRGLLCTLLAADGATAAAGALESRQGFFNVYNGAGRHRAQALLTLGEGFELLRSGLTFKRYPCCGSTHAPIDAAAQLRQRHGLRSADIAAVEVAVNARRRPHVDRPVVNDELAAKFSLQYTVAAALADGQVGLEHFSAASIQRADLQDLLGRVTVAGLEGGDVELAQGCEIRVQTTAGQQFALRLDDAQGRSAEAYRRSMKAKFDDCVQHHVGAAVADAWLQALLAFERCPNVDPLITRLAVPTGAPTRPAP